MLIDKSLEVLLRGEITKNGWKKNFLSGALVNLDSKLVETIDDMPFNNDNTRVVRSFEMHLKYMPRDNHTLTKGDFALFSYMLTHGAVFLFSWEDFLEKSKENTPDGKVLKWIKENTNICETIFNIARTNQEYRVPLSFDVIEYGKKLVGDKYETYPFLTTPIVGEIEKEYTRIYRDEFLKDARTRMNNNNRLKKEAAGKCQQ